MEKAFGIILKERRSKQLYRKKHGQEKEKYFVKLKLEIHIMHTIIILD